ncbi:hypothetical protein GCM10018785_27230 [Streptomyces longispororuber]|uniref:Uncharacterized protein n=1 Tax=Streptomyces longispororuber TaxID=68230 RepID=A0A918ZJR7_9ACTN|nr:hypothetical protein [Streptomyces longispororuber]GHE56477.1 hypothetical protein GCM10018785_27230 [Streptomyces longispororuber]
MHASMTFLPSSVDERPPLRRRPPPHERDGRDEPAPEHVRPHPQQPHTAVPDPVVDEALRRVVEEQIGPRAPGAIYQNVDGAFEVLSVVREPEQARVLLRRRSARWAVIVRDVLRPGAEPFAVGSVWTTSDRLVREACVASGGR